MTLNIVSLYLFHNTKLDLIPVRLFFMTVKYSQRATVYSNYVQ